MKKKIFACLLGLLILVLAISSSHAEGTKNSSFPKIYDGAADGTKQISEALAVAKKEHKRVLLDFGANWCIWCQRLHKLFENNKDVSAELKSGYVVVMIDVNEGRNKEADDKYGNPRKKGIPALVVLDSDGKQLKTQETGALEEGDHHSPEKVMSFLKEWAPKH